MHSAVIVCPGASTISTRCERVPDVVPAQSTALRVRPIASGSADAVIALQLPGLGLVVVMPTVSLSGKVDPSAPVTSMS